ncbi:MAG TPA: ABC transporter substrate-binding protein [Chloroflexota bacterium]|jgi:NitT/TauT family transport system substrate-binding protein
MCKRLRVGPIAIVRFALAVAGVAVALACAAPSPRSADSTGPAPASPAMGGPGAAPAQPVPLRVAYSEIYPGNTVPWTAYEAGIFAAHGLDVALSYVPSSQTVPAVIANEIDVALGGGYAVINSRLAGSDLKMIFAVVNFYQYELMVSPEVASPADLRGKKLGVSRFGSSSDQSTRLLLRLFNLVPDQDVVLVQTGSLQERVAAMQAGAVAGGLAGPADIPKLRQLGFTSLYDLSKSGQQDLNNVAFASEAWLADHEAHAQAFVDALVEAIHYVKTNRAVAQQVLGTYLKLDDPVLLDELHERYVGANLARVPDPGYQATERYLHEQAETDPRAAAARLNDFFDTRFVDRVNASGLVERLYGSSP